MNTVSWLLYLADVAGNLRSVASAGLLLMGITVPIIGVGMGAYHAESGPVPTGLFSRLFVTGFFSAALLAAILVVTPSPATVYMIAASEAGETVVTSPEAKGILNDLREIISRKLKAELGEVRT